MVGMSTPELRWIRSTINDKVRSRALSVLSPVELERYGSTVAANRDSFLAGRMLLRDLAADLTNATPAAVHLEAVCPECGGPHGQPVLVDSDLHLSLSHAGDVVVAAASWGSPVGIDVENRVQPPERVTAIGALTGEASVLHWTRVEAILKADGRGLRVDPSMVEILEHDGIVEGWVTDRPTRYAVTETDLGADLMVSVAVAL